jgi:membrane protein DedA with SNARE-associated domain
VNEIKMTLDDVVGWMLASVTFGAMVGWAIGYLMGKIYERDAAASPPKANGANREKG